MKKVFDIGISVASYALIGFTCIQSKIYYNKNTQKTLDTDETNLDTTRPQYLRFGINWGAGADLMVMEEMDSGDLLFSKMNCSKTLNLHDFVHCYTSIFLEIGDYQSMGIIIRTSNDIKVISHSFGRILVSEYPEYISRIHNKKILLKKLRIVKLNKFDREIFEKEIQIKGEQILEEIEEMESKDRQVTQSKFLNLVLGKIGVLEKNDDFLSIDDVSKGRGFKSNIQLDEDLIIRHK